MRKRPSPRPNRPHLRLEALEAREVPAVLLQIDYSYDTGFFKNNAAARAVMERVAGEIGGMLNANLTAITPGGSNTWTATFYNPATGSEVSIANLSVASNTLKVFVGARSIPGPEGGFGGAGGYILSGSTAWNNATLSRGHSGYAPWGGSITFDSSDNWFFGQSTSGLGSTQIDFYTVAMHEMGHLLGIGTSPQWNANLSGSSFVGSSSRGVYGGPVPLSPDRAHWADGVTTGGAATVMDPNLPRGTRVAWTALDSAALRDVGWNVTVTAPPTVPPPPTLPPTNSPPPPASPPATSPPPVVSPPPAPKKEPTVAFAGGADGTLAVYKMEGGSLVAAGRYTPFSGYRGELRVAGGDFNGDGITDYAVATGSGAAVVAVLNGKDGSFLVSPTMPFAGYNGGLYVAAGDIDRDGKDDLIVALGQNAPPVVQIYRVDGGLKAMASFTAFDAAGWRGGIRVAAGDINNDGYADVVVTTGSQLGLVGFYNGADLRNGAATRLRADFLPFGGLPIGVVAAVGDMDGDGYAEVALSLERGAPPYVAVWSGKEMSKGGSGAPLAAFLPLPVDPNGSRVAMRDLNGDGRAELIAAGGGAAGIGRAFTFEQVRSGGGGSTVYPGLAGGPNGIFVG